MRVQGWLAGEGCVAGFDSTGAGVATGCVAAGADVA
jgi:hypothetical protein